MLKPTCVNTGMTQNLGDNTDLEHAPFCSNSTVKTPRGIHRKSVFDGLCRMTQVNNWDGLLERLTEMRDCFAFTPLGAGRVRVRW